MYYSFYVGTDYYLLCSRLSSMETANTHLEQYDRILEKFD